MLDAEREAVRTLRRTPALLVGGGAAVAASLVAGAAVLAVVAPVPVPEGTRPLLVLLAASPATIPLAPLVLAGLYVAVRRAREGDGDADAGDGDAKGSTLAALVRGAVGNYRPLLVATVAFRPVVLALAVPVFGLLLAGDAALNYAQYAAGGGGVPPPVLELWVAGIYVLLAGALARLPLAFYDLPVLFAGVPPRRGPRAALRFARRRPRVLLRYGAGRLLLSAPLVVLWVAGAGLVAGQGDLSTTAPGLAVVAAGYLVVGVPAAALVATYHVVVYERRVEPALREPTATGSDGPAPDSVLAPPRGATGDAGGRNRRSVVVGAVVLLLASAAIAGAGAVRVSDHRPLPDSGPRPVDASMDAAAIVENARAATAATSHRRVVSTYAVNGSTGERALLIEVRAARDRPDHRLRVSAVVMVNRSTGERRTADYYISESTLAARFGSGTGGELEYETRATGFPGRTVDGWAVVPYPGYGFAGNFDDTAGIPEGGDWRVIERDDGRIVVGFTERPDDDADGEGSRLVERRVRVTVDPATGWPSRAVENRTVVEVEDGTVVERDRELTVAAYDEFGTADVERPRKFGSRGPLEWLWDLLYY